MGALVTLDLPADSPVLAMPWIITFGPLSDDAEWEPVVCGPYERPHALALAEAVVADEELMAVIEPLLPHVHADEIRGEIAAAQLAVLAEQEAASDDDDSLFPEHEHLGDDPPASTPPSVEEIRAGFARIAARLASVGSR